MVDTKKQIKGLARSRHHKGRAGHSRHPFYFNDAATLEELRKEVCVREAEVIA